MTDYKIDLFFLSPIAISAEIKNYENGYFELVLDDYQSNVLFI
jgi:hypothetical protein